MLAAFDNYLLKRLGLKDSLNAVLSEIKVANSFVLVECPKCVQALWHCAILVTDFHRCERSTYVNKGEHHESKVVACPSPGCSYVWCKTCTWVTEANTAQAREHSCEGAIELRELVNKQGWRYCPGQYIPGQPLHIILRHLG